MDILERDIENFSSNIVELVVLSRSLVEKENFDQENIKKQQVLVEQRYSLLQDLVIQRRSRFLEIKRLFQFYREVDDVIIWIVDKMVIVLLEDYGQDLEYVEVRILFFFEVVLNNGIIYLMEILVCKIYYQSIRLDCKMYMYILQYEFYICRL